MGSSTAGSTTRTLAGRYRLGATIGAGTTAKVFDAVDLTDETPVVVKMLPGSFGASPTFMERFLADVGSAADLSHPNIARIRDFGVERMNDRSYPFVVTESFTGGSLRSLLDRGRQLTPSQALVVGLDVCRGLDHAHRRGLVHGSISPGNLLFGMDRKVRIVDFGLSRLLSEITWAHPERIDVDTARYASPEQAQGRPAGPKSDVYTLCLSLIEAVTGQVPFAADTAVATLATRVDRLMPVSADLGSLAAVLERAGRPDPDDRASAAEFGKALVQAAQTMPRPTPIQVVGIGLFGDVTGSMPLVAEPPSTPGDGAQPAARPPAAAPAPPAAAPAPPAAQGRVLEPNVPPPREVPAEAAPMARDAGPAAGVVVRPRPVVPIDTSPPLPDEGPADEPVMPTAVYDPGLVITLAEEVAVTVDDEGGEEAPEDTAPKPATLAMAAPPPPPPPKKHTATVETVEGDDDAPDISRRSMFTYVLVALGIALAAVIALIGYRALSTPAYTVPNLIGVSEAEAGNQVAANGWEVQVVRQRDDSVAQGDVIRTEPSAGEKVDKGGRFVLYVSDGPTLAVLPELTGVPLTQARTLLEEAGLVLREAERANDESVPAGTVLVWSVPVQAGLVAGDEVPKGTTVEVVVSDGPAARQVPNLVGLTVAEARQALADAGLGLGLITEQIDEAVPAGEIISAEPGAGTSLARGGTVAVVVSKGPDVVAVPDLRGMTRAEMEAALAAVNLVVGSTSGPADGTVAAQTPAPGSQVARGTRVHVTFGT